MQTQDPVVVAIEEWEKVFMYHSMHSLMLFTRQRGLKVPQIGALFEIHRSARGVSDLGENMGITSAAASQMLERLVQQGYILRSEDPHDRRVKKVVLTEKGRQTMLDSINARMEWIEGLVKTFTSAEKEQIVEALHILIDRSRQLKLFAEPKGESIDFN